MTISVEAMLVVSLLMAVFAAVSTVGTSLYLGAGFERLRAGFENIKKQTAFFSDAIRKLDRRVGDVEKQSGYFFEAISSLEQRAAETPLDDGYIPMEADDVEQIVEEKLILAAKDDALHAGAECLLTAQGFISAQPPGRMHFH